MNTGRLRERDIHINTQPLHALCGSIATHHVREHQSAGVGHEFGVLAFPAGLNKHDFSRTCGVCRPSAPRD